MPRVQEHIPPQHRPPSIAEVTGRGQRSGGTGVNPLRRRWANNLELTAGAMVAAGVLLMVVVQLIDGLRPMLTPGFFVVVIGASAAAAAERFRRLSPIPKA